MIFHVRRFGLTVAVTCLLATALLVASGAALAKGPLYEPDYDYRIVPPYQTIGIAEGKELKNVSYQLTDCVWVMTSFELFGPATQVHKNERTVTAIVPASMDLTNERVINGLIVGGWREAWKNCFSGYIQNDTNYTDFSGVRVMVVQRKERLINTGRVKVADDNSIYIDEINNFAVERKAAKLQAQAEADAQLQLAEEARIAEQSRITQSKLDAERDKQFFLYFRFVLFAMTLGMIIWCCIAFWSPLATQIRWLFAPPREFQQLRKAARQKSGLYATGKRLGDALRYVPKNNTESFLVRKEIENIRRTIARRLDNMSAQQDLKAMLIELEKAKARLEELQSENEHYA